MISIVYDYDFSCFLREHKFLSVGLIVRCGMFTSEAFSRHVSLRSVRNSASSGLFELFCFIISPLAISAAFYADNSN